MTDSSAPNKLVVIAKQAVLPGSDTPQPATVEVDRVRGIITAVNPGSYADSSKHVDSSNVEVISLEAHQVLLPGLIE